MKSKPKYLYRQTGCEGKFKYKTYKMAHRVMGVMIRKGMEGPFRIYTCRYCDFFHVGHVPAEMRKKRAG